MRANKLPRGSGIDEYFINNQDPSVTRCYMEWSQQQQQQQQKSSKHEKKKKRNTKTCRCVWRMGKEFEYKIRKYNNNRAPTAAAVLFVSNSFFSLSLFSFFFFFFFFLVFNVFNQSTWNKGGSMICCTCLQPVRRFTWTGGPACLTR